MPENKTKPTDASVENYIASRANEQRRIDCQELMALLEMVTQQVYLDCEGSRQNSLLAKLGKHKMGKACLMLKQLTTPTCFGRAPLLTC